MTGEPQNILQRIGNTSLMPLRTIVPVNGSRIFLKLESENPTGSMKDRMALAMIEAAEVDGRLAPAGAAVEYTAGSTGVSLALVCAVKRHPLHIVTSNAFAQEKLDHMALLGATLQVLQSDNGKMTEGLTHAMIDAARTVANATGAFFRRSNEKYGSSLRPITKWRTTSMLRQTATSIDSSRVWVRRLRFAAIQKSCAGTIRRSQSLR